MKRFLSLFLLLASVPALSSAAEVISSNFRGKNAYADFGYVNGCIVTSAFVFATEIVDNFGPGKPNSGAGMLANVTRYNQCTGVLELSAFGSRGLLTGLVFEKESASLSTTLQVFDGVSGTYVDLSVNLVWNAFGVEDNSMSITRSVYPEGTRSTFRSIGTSTVSSAVGSISDGTYEYAGQYFSATLANTRSGFILVAKP